MEERDPPHHRAGPLDTSVRHGGLRTLQESDRTQRGSAELPGTGMARELVLRPTVRTTQSYVHVHEHPAKRTQAMTSCSAE